ncbi:hypothetical protein K0J45_14470 [Shewanella alkalitolerans]|uniref:hypothetical protein n=1 Tax=Shewanella alkalitolerans TaxID=2864209 RepID=UPI001C65F435|nr:hypothetical protein [Shewanella alkalitolerans]QYJ99742.1 hypothetical protein K0J45_14470 [Shewanella alkalitolerans]
MIVKWWRAYIAWCDRMGLTPENQRCCAPKLSDPQLDKPELKDSNLSSSSQEVQKPQQALQESKESQAPRAKADDVSR